MKENFLETMFFPIMLRPSEFLNNLDLSYRKGLKYLFRASDYASKIFLSQNGSDTESCIQEVKLELAAATENENKEKIVELTRRLKLLNLFLSHYSKPDNLNFLPSRPSDEKYFPGFYPKGSTKEIIESYISLHPEEKEKLLNPYTVVVSDDNNSTFKSVPYSVYFSKFINPLCENLDKAAKSFSLIQPEFSHFLSHRSKSLQNNSDLYESELKWVTLPPTIPIDIAIGPVLVYEDILFGFKGSYESIVMVRAEKETEKLKEYLKYCDSLELNIPLNEKYRKVKGSNNGNNSINNNNSNNNNTNNPAVNNNQSRLEVFNIIYLGGSTSVPFYVMGHNMPQVDILLLLLILIY
jgi:hypothetical protein